MLITAAICTMYSYVPQKNDHVSYFGIVTGNLSLEGVELDRMILKSLTLNYVKISVSYLIYHSDMTISPIRPLK